MHVFKSLVYHFNPHSVPDLSADLGRVDITLVIQVFKNDVEWYDLCNIYHTHLVCLFMKFQHYNSIILIKYLAKSSKFALFFGFLGSKSAIMEFILKQIKQNGC